MAGLLMKYQNGVGGIVLASSSINSDKSELKMAVADIASKWTIFARPPKDKSISYISNTHAIMELELT